MILVKEQNGGWTYIEAELDYVLFDIFWYLYNQKMNSHFICFRQSAYSSNRECNVIRPKKDVKYLQKYNF